MTKENFAEIVLDSKESLYRVAKTILKNDTDCEDAVSEAIVKGFLNLHTLKKDIYAKTWLTRILINECYGILSRRKRETNYEESISLEEQYEYGYSEIYENIMNLELSYRMTIMLFYIEGYNTREIAKITGVSIGTVKSRLSRARKQLRKMMDKEEYCYESKKLAGQ